MSDSSKASDAPTNYAAPLDLAAARRRIDGIAEARLRSTGHGGAAVPNAALVLEPGRPEDQLARLTDKSLCVISEMVLWRWDAASIQALCRALNPDGVLLFLEPTADLGWRRAAHRIGQRWWRARLGYDFESDIPASIRATGMTVTTTDRFGLGPAEIRSYAWGEAQYF